MPVAWLVYGNRRGVETPTWKELLANAKDYEINKNFRMEIVELESAFEVFLVGYLKKRLEEKYNQKIVHRIFEYFKSIDLITSLVFGMATGKTLRDTLEEAGKVKLFKTWHRDVREERNKILHEGVSDVDPNKAKKGFEAVFKIIILLDSESLKYLCCSFEKYENLGEG